VRNGADQCVGHGIGVIGEGAAGKGLCKGNADKGQHQRYGDQTSDDKVKVGELLMSGGKTALTHGVMVLQPVADSDHGDERCDAGGDALNAAGKRGDQQTAEQGTPVHARDKEHGAEKDEHQSNEDLRHIFNKADGLVVFAVHPRKREGEREDQDPVDRTREADAGKRRHILQRIGAKCVLAEGERPIAETGADHAGDDGTDELALVCVLCRDDINFAVNGKADPQCQHEHAE